MRLVIGAAIGVFVALSGCGGASQGGGGTAGSAVSGTAGSGVAGMAGGAAGSGGGGSGAGGGASGVAGASAGGAGGGGTQSLSLTFGPLTVAPAADVTKCVVVRLGNASAVHVGVIRNQLGAGVINVAVYKSNDTTEQSAPFDCRSVEYYGSSRDLLMFSRTADDTLTMPAGIGRTFDADQMIRLEVHAFNDTPDAVAIQTTTTFTAIADASFQKEAAAFLIDGANVVVSRGSKQASIFISVPSSVTAHSFFAIAGFQHKYGLGVTVATAAGATATPSSPVYAPPSYDWRAPPTVYPTTPFTVPDGGGFAVTCDWNNTGSKQVSLGPTAAEEACTVVAYYAPGDRFRFCTNALDTTFCCPNAEQPQYCVDP